MCKKGGAVLASFKLSILCKQSWPNKWRTVSINTQMGGSRRDGLSIANQEMGVA